MEMNNELIQAMHKLTDAIKGISAAEEKNAEIQGQLVEFMTSQKEVNERNTTIAEGSLALQREQFEYNKTIQGDPATDTDLALKILLFSIVRKSEIVSKNNISSQDILSLIEELLKDEDVKDEIQAETQLLMETFIDAAKEKFNVVEVEKEEEAF